MRLAIYGAGAIGAFLGAKLALAGQDVTLIARGPHLKAMQANGVTVRTAQGELQAHPSATDDPDAVGAVDFLFLTVKAHSLTAIAPQLKPLIGPETAVVSAQNGIPGGTSSDTAGSGTAHDWRASTPAVSSQTR